MPEIIPAHGPGLWWQAARLRPRTRDLDAFFAPYFLPPGFRGRSVVYNFGIYEGRYAIPGWRAKAHSRHIAYSARRASLVLANCPTTKADLVSCYGIEPSNIRVLPEGRDPRFRPAQPGDESEIAQAAGQTLGTDDPYFLFVGKTSLRRHVRELLAAFAMAASSAPRIQLLLVGPNTTRVPIERIAGDLGVLDRVHHKPYLDHDVIRLLYRGARAFVTPSEKDGFPTTLLEALASGCPSITLRGASLGVLEFLDGPRDHAEGGPVLEAADASPASLAEVIGRLADDDELCVELGRRGERYASTFPAWEETAAVIMDALVEVAGGNGLRDAVTESWDPG
jgi:alpha-1,3-rhamnosyl/mannosyltransferase